MKSSLKIITLLLFIISNFTSKAQLKEEYINKLQLNIKTFLEEADPDFNSNAVPEKWKEQSGVILAQKTAMMFDQRSSFRLLGKSDRKVIVQEKERRKIKLLDNNAVEQFSELYFDVSDADNGFGGKVIKEDGKEEPLDLSRAIVVEDAGDVPGLFRSYTQNGHRQFFKIPVSDLQPGDILDYAYLVNNDAAVKDNFLEFQPVYYQCHRSYSIVKQQFDIKLDNKTFLNNRSLNGAPEFTEKNEGEFTTYTWVDRDREKLRDQNFVNNYLLLPMVKFQIVFSNKEDAGNLFIGSHGEMKTKLTPEELGKKISNIYAGMNDAYGGQLVNQIKYHMKKMDAMDVTDDSYIRNTYYIMRHLNIMNEYNYSSPRFCLHI